MVNVTKTWWSVGITIHPHGHVLPCFDAVAVVGKCDVAEVGKRAEDYKKHSPSPTALLPVGI